MKKLRVLVLMHDDLVPPSSLRGHSQEEIYRWRMEYDVLHGLQELGHEVIPLGVSDELAPIRSAIEQEKPHIAFDLLRYFHDVTIYDSYVVSYLELLKTPYTGCNPRGLLLANDKALSKKILQWHRIPIPAFRIFRRSRSVRKPARLHYPLFVKSATEHASLGIAQKSIVTDDESLRERVALVHRNLGSDALAEDYIEGRELYVGVMGNERLQTLPIWELTFKNLPEGSAPIATARVKWDLKYQKKLGVKTTRAADLPDGMEESIPRMAKRIYRALGLSGYARIDLRLTEEGRIYVLEANPNPDLCKDEDFAVSAKAAGIEYPQLIQRLVNYGIRYSPAWKQE